MKSQFEQFVKMPVMLTKEQFSFHAASVVLGAATTFIVGHTFLPTGASFALTFSHPLAAVGATCLDDDISVLTCGSSQDKLTLNCVKEDVATVNSCTLSVTFASDF